MIFKTHPDVIGVKKIVKISPDEEVEQDKTRQTGINGRLMKF